MVRSGESQPVTPGYDRNGGPRRSGSVVSSLLTPGAPLFHKTKESTPLHSIESMDNLISIEDGDEPVHCTRGVMWAGRDVISEDAPGIFHSSQYRVLIRVVHVRASR